MAKKQPGGGEVLGLEICLTVKTVMTLLCEMCDNQETSENTSGSFVALQIIRLSNSGPGAPVAELRADTRKSALCRRIGRIKQR